MAQRRSRNRRKSSINASGILDQNTNVYNDDDPLWYNKSIVRPSTSLSVTRNASSLLNPDSNLNESQITERWFNNLSKSESTKLIEENTRKNHAVNQEDDEDDSSHVNPTTESESEHESQKRRARFGMNQKKSNKSDKSNAFLKALEQTTDSHTKNLTRVQIREENESHVTSDESRTIRKMLPNTYKNKKQATEETTDNFDELFNSDSASEKIQMNACSSTPTLKKKNNKNNDSIDDVARKLRKKQTENIEKMKQSTNAIKNLPSLDTSVTQSRNKSITKNSTKVVKKSLKKNRPIVIEDTVLSTSITEKYPKRRAPLFSQENKSKTENFFDAALNSSTETIKLLNQEGNDKIPSDEDQADDANRSESSSIPKNIRRTKSISTFPARQSQNGNSINNKNGPESPEEESDDNVNEILTNHHATQEKSQSKNKLNNTSKLLNKSKENNSLSQKFVTSSHQNISINENVSINGYNKKGNEEEMNTGSEELSDNQSKQLKSNKKEKSRTRLSKRKESHVISKSKDSAISSNNLKRNLSTSSIVDVINYSDKSSEEEILSSPNVTDKNKTRPLKRKISDEESDNEKESSKISRKSKSKTALNDSRFSSKSINKSVKNSINGTLTKSKRQEISRNNIQDESDGDTSTMPKYIRRTKSRLFFTENSLEKDNDENEILDVVTPTEQDEINLHVSSEEKTKESLNKSVSLLRDRMLKNQSLQVQVAVERIPEKIISREEKTNENHSKTERIVNNSMNESRSKNVTSKKTPRNSESVETPKESNEKNVSISQSNLKGVEKSLINGRDESREKSVETSSDGVSDVVQNQDKVNHQKTLSPQKSMIRPNVSDDLIQTPNPGQSTLNPHGKPLTRITEFFSFGNNVINEDDSGSSVSTAPSKSVTPPSPTRQSEEKDEEKIEENDEREDEDVDVTHDSDVSENPLISRKLDDIPPDSEKSTHNDELTGLLNIGRHSKRKSRIEDYMVVSDEAKWAEIKKKTDAIKAEIGERMKQEEKIRQDREREKLLIEKKFQLAMRKAEAEKKKKQRMPVDKAYYVNGKIYKQPKLPRPKQWVTDKLYKYLWRCMEPKFGHKTRVKSEEFIVELSNIVTVISRRKKYGNYKSDLDKLLITMAKLNIIETRYDFYRFCSDFMPYSFRIKVVPMQLPGNERNIPYDPDSVFKPILKAKRLSTPQVEESNHESESETNNEDQNESNNESDSKSGSETSED